MPCHCADRFFLAETWQPARLRKLYIRETGGAWNSYTPTHDSPAVRALGFANDDTLVTMYGGKLVAQTVEGTEFFESAMPEHGLFPSSWSTSATSTKGDRFAVILGRMRGLRSEPLDMNPFWSEDRVTVYSTPQKGAIFAVKQKGPSPWPIDRYPAWNRIALSPNGLLLAISSNEGVRVYAVPPDAQPKH